MHIPFRRKERPVRDLMAALEASIAAARAGEPLPEKKHRDWWNYIGAAFGVLFFVSIAVPVWLLTIGPTGPTARSYLEAWGWPDLFGVAALIVAGACWGIVKLTRLLRDAVQRHFR